MGLSLITSPAAITIVMLAAVVTPQVPTTEPTPGSMTVVYNHEGSSELLQRGGFSVHVRLADSSVLFDVGGEASIIMENLARRGIGNELDAVVISHNHWDHVYGLPGVMSLTHNAPPLYVAASAAVGVQQQFPSATVVAVDAPTQIAPDIWLTGPFEVEFMGAPLSEQAVVLDHPLGLHILAGCSHPGIVAIVKRAKEIFPDRPVALAAGGFHLRSAHEEDIRRIASELEALGVQKIGASHCSGADAVRIFREHWGDAFVSFDLGDSYQF